MVHGTIKKNKIEIVENKESMRIMRLLRLNMPKPGIHKRILRPCMVAGNLRKAIYYRDDRRPDKNYE